MSAIVIPLPWTKPPLTGNRTRGNPYARAGEVKTAKAEAWLAIRDANPRHVVGADVTLHFRPSTKQRRDADGLFPTLKVCQDALVLAGVLPEDSWVTVPAATCRIHPPTGEPAAMWLELSAIHAPRRTDMTETTPADDRTDLRSEIKHALNRASAENGSDTPDHVLADYLLASLDAFDAATHARSAWYGHHSEITYVAPSIFKEN